MVVPTLDPGPYLLDSVRGCGVRDEVAEVIVVNDHSTDLTNLELLDGIPGVRVVDNPGSRGVAAARLHGASLAEADHLLFLDDDDLVLGEHLPTAAAQHDLGFGMVISAGWRLRAGRLLPLYGMPQRDLSRERMARKSWIASPGQVSMTRAAYETAGGFRVGPEGADDYDLWLRMFTLDLPRVFTGAPTFVYRERPGSLTRRVSLDDSAVAVRRAAGLPPGEDAMSPVRRARAAVAGWVRQRRSRPASGLHWTDGGWELR